MQGNMQGNNQSVPSLLSMISSIPNGLIGMRVTQNNGQNTQNINISTNIPQSQSQNSSNQMFSSIMSSLPQIINMSTQITQFFMNNLINSGQSFRRAT
jgi:hypothetical protein